jgi:hypothetical protein
MFKTESACLLIADISGYTSYLAGVELDHAQDILADLIGTVVTALRPNFKLAKLEGDAAFVVASPDKVDGSLLLDVLERCYFGFRRRRRDVRQATSCECNACLRIPDLNLKFVTHVGLIGRQRMAGHEELVGSDVIVIHRMLKNTVVEDTGIAAYALLSQACIDMMKIDPAALDMRPHVETYEHLGEVHGWIHDLERRWQEEEQRKRVFVTPAESVFTVSIPTKAPPQVAWEFLTTPGRRTAWQAGVTDVIVAAKGNRRGVGATNHCMHGADAVIEDILDWRPYDYLSQRTTLGTPGGLVKLLGTVELEPTTDGTIVHFRYAAPTTAREQGIIGEMLPALEGVFAQSGRSLVANLDAELAARGGDGGDEPQLPAPKPDGIFAGVQPIVMIQ